MEQNRLNDEINKKENKIEAEKIIKETTLLKDKNNHFEGELKLATHKIQKIEILNEKAERLKAKKEVEFMREIQEKVKNQLKGNSQGPPSKNLSAMNQTSNFGRQNSLPHNTGSSPISAVNTPQL